MKKLHDNIIEVLENKEWRIYDITEQDGDFYVEIENWSRAGENLVECIWFDGTNEGFIKAIRKWADEFDPEEHAKALIENKGKNGIPDSIKVLINDAEAIDEMFSELADALEKIEIVSKVRLTIELEIANNELSLISSEDVLKNIVLEDHNDIDGFELTTDINGFDRTSDFFLQNGKIVKKEFVEE